jgi:Mn-dependent DtxR family transcriptional regulator
MPQGKRSVSDSEIVDAFEEIEGPFAGASEIAEFFGHTRQWAHQRLSELHEEGTVNKKKTGKQSVVWWVED